MWVWGREVNDPERRPLGTYGLPERCASRRGCVSCDFGGGGGESSNPPSLRSSFGGHPASPRAGRQSCEARRAKQGVGSQGESSNPSPYAPAELRPTPTEVGFGRRRSGDQPALLRIAGWPATRSSEGAQGGGRGGIRTHGELAPTAVFKTAALNHSATLPDRQGYGEDGTMAQGVGAPPPEALAGRPAIVSGHCVASLTAGNFTGRRACRSSGPVPPNRGSGGNSGPQDSQSPPRGDIR